MLLLGPLFSLIGTFIFHVTQRTIERNGTLRCAARDTRLDILIRSREEIVPQQVHSTGNNTPQLMSCWLPDERSHLEPYLQSYEKAPWLAGCVMVLFMVVASG